MDIQKIREDFPILSRTVYGKPLVYFDNGATTQKPRLVVDASVGWIDFFSFLPESRIGFCIYTVSCCMGYLPVGRS